MELARSIGAKRMGTLALNTLPPLVTAAIALTLSGCSLVQRPSDDRAETVDQPDLARHIEIEVEDLDRGLPCSVIDRPDAGIRKVLWRAEFEGGFCHRKARQTRLILQDQGWACRPQGADERPDLVQRPADASDSNGAHLIAAWRCVGGLTPIDRPDRVRPPVPSARPDQPASRSASRSDEPLRQAVEKDLATIGQKVIGDDTSVDTALGDLNGDDIDDAVVVLTRDDDRGRPHRLLMAYLQSGETYTLVDVWILEAPSSAADGGVDVAIEDGTVHIGDCCDTEAEPIVLVLDNRKLAYAKGTAEP